MYIGSAVNFNKRWNEHRLLLRKNKHHCKYLQNAWNKDGEDSFEFSEVEFVDKADLITKEQYYFDLLNPEYNSCPTAGNTLGCSWKLSEETKRRMKKPKSKEHAKNSASGRKGIHFTEEAKQNMRKPKSKEHRQKLSNAKIADKNPWYGKTRPDHSKMMKNYWQEKRRAT